MNEVGELNEGVWERGGRSGSEWEGVVFLFKCGKEWEGVGGCEKEWVGFIKPRKEQGLSLS